MTFTRTTLLFSSLIALTGASCGPDAQAPEPEAVGETDSSIIGGRVDRRHDAVGRVGVDRRGPSDVIDWICTGTLIGSRTVLTAAHCLMGRTGRATSASRLRFESSGSVFAAARAEIAPGYAPGTHTGWDDIALIILHDDPSAAPIPVSRLDPRQGEPARVIGFGVTRATGPQAGFGAGTRRQTRITLGRVAARELLYEVDGHGACYGDSGGPVLQYLGEGEVVVGVTSRGTDVACSDVDIATRTDPFVAWIAEVQGREP